MTKMMRAFVMTGAKEGSIQNLPCFAPEPGDAVVQTAATAICTTERRIFAGSLKVSYPVIGGHEVSGIVVETPDDSSNLKVGDKVVLDAINRCGFCYHCIRGHSNLCEKAYNTERQGYRIVGGGFGQFVTISTKRVFGYWGDIGPEEAALSEPLACCVHSVKRSRIQFGDVVVVVGAGTMGILHVLLTKMMGAQVLVLDINKDRLSMARAIGADWVADVSEEDPVAVVADRSDGRKADAVFVAASTRSAGESALQMVGTRGQVIFFASTHPPARLDVPWNLLHDREVSLLGSVGKSEEDFREAVALLSNGLINVRPLVSKIISLPELNWELSEHLCGPVQRVVVRQDGS